MPVGLALAPGVATAALTATAGVEHDLAGLARLEQREGALELVERKLVGDQRPEVDDAVLEQPAAPVPGGEDLAAADRGDASGS